MITFKSSTFHHLFYKEIENWVKLSFTDLNTSTRKGCEKYFYRKSLVISTHTLKSIKLRDKNVKNIIFEYLVEDYSIFSLPLKNDENSFLSYKFHMFKALRSDPCLWEKIVKRFFPRQHHHRYFLQAILLQS